MIIENKKAYFDFFIEETFEAGLVLEGWEVKSIRSGKGNIRECYVSNLKGELCVVGMNITPLTSAGTHQNCDPTRTRKLMLNKKEINMIVGKINVEGYTVVPLDLHYHNGKIKMKIGVAKGKKNNDKRDTIKEREWDREKSRVMKSKNL